MCRDDAIYGMLRIGGRALGGRDPLRDAASPRTVISQASSHKRQVPSVPDKCLACPGKENTPEGGVYFVLYVFVLYFVLYLYFWAPATRDRCGGRKRDGASCLGGTLGTWLCSMSNSIIYHVSCYRFVSQHTYIYHIG
jgi:hypothetical protein